MCFTLTPLTNSFTCSTQNRGAAIDIFQLLYIYLHDYNHVICCCCCCFLNLIDHFKVFYWSVGREGRECHSKTWRSQGKFGELGTSPPIYLRQSLSCFWHSCLYLSSHCRSDGIRDVCPCAWLFIYMGPSRSPGLWCKCLCPPSHLYRLLIVPWKSLQHVHLSTKSFLLVVILTLSNIFV